MEIDKFLLLEEVRKRPVVWSSRVPPFSKSRQKFDKHWNEIANAVGVDVTNCKRVWQLLRAQFQWERRCIPKRIAKAKARGNFDPNKNYSTWAYAEAIKFLEQARNYSKSYTNVYADTQAYKDQSNSLPTEIDNDIEFIDSYSSDQTQSENGNNYESDNSMELMDNKILHRKSEYIENNVFQNECKKINENFLVDDSANSKHTELKFKSYKISVLDLVEKNENECATISKNCTIRNITAVTAELEQQNDPVNLPITTEVNNELRANKLSTVSIPPLRCFSENRKLSLVVSNATRNPSTYSKEHTLDSTNTSDIRGPSILYPTDLEFIACHDSDQKQSETDIELRDNKLQQKQSINIENNDFQNEFNNIDASTLTDNSANFKQNEINFKPYKVSVLDFIEKTENENSAAIREKLRVQNELEDIPLKTVANKLSIFSTPAQSHCSEGVNLPEVISNAHVAPDLSTYSQEHISDSPVTSDGDFYFLLSLIEQIKQMTQSQKEKFYEVIRSLLLNVSISSNVLEKQLLLPEYNDPDKKVLTNFWPLLKSMSLMQNLQFRSKMVHLVLGIFTETS